MDKEEFLKVFAKELTDSEFNDKGIGIIPRIITEAAKNTGVVIVYGQSDDLMELEGALYDEFDCYEGGIFYLDKEGNRVKQKTENRIKAVWCDKNSDWTWSYKTTIPHENFEMMDEGEKYCQGFIFYKEDLK